MYIAIDGGGTKTEYLLLDEHFEVRERYLGACVNHDFLPDGWEGTFGELRGGISTLLEKGRLGIEDVEDVTAGLAGIDTRIDQRQMETCMKRIGLKRFAVCNDGFLSVLAECPGGWGIAYNCGTGVCCAGIDEKQNRVKTAGLDEWSGDAGGGNWIVQQVFRQVYSDLVYWRMRTPFAQRYMEELKLETEEDVVDSLSLLRYPADHPELQIKVIRLLFELLDSGDAEAVSLTDRMLQCAYANVLAVIKGLEFPQSEIPLVLTGSIHTKAASREYLRRLGEVLQKAADNRLKIHMASKAPVWGAVQWLRERKG